MPEASDLTAPFWEATRSHRYLLQWCDECNRPIFYPRYACPSCLGNKLSWRPSNGVGTIHAFTVVHTRAVPSVVGDIPFVVVFIDLDEGVRIVSNLIGYEPSDVRVGQRVELIWNDLADGRAIPLFRPDYQLGAATRAGGA